MKKDKLALILAYVLLIISAYFAFVQYTVLSVISIYCIIVFLKMSKNNKTLLFYLALSIIILGTGLLRTIFGMG